jgi:hypothetical protein
MKWSLPALLMAKGSSPWTLPSLWLLALVLLNDLSLFGMTVDKFDASGDKVNLWSRFDTSGVNLRSRLDDTSGGVRSGFLTGRTLETMAVP